MSKPWRDEQRLRELYWDKEMSQRSIGEKLGCSPRTVRTWMDKYNIEKRTTTEAVEVSESSEADDRPWQNESTLRHLYCEKDMSVVEIANELDGGHNTIHKWLEKHEIKTKKPNDQKPPHHGFNTRGYERWRHDTGDKQYHVLVHRLLAVSEYGLDSVKDKVFHHENCMKCDNRPSNISWMNLSEHSSYHNSP